MTRRNILSLILALAMTMALVACGSNNAGSGSDAGSDEKVTLDIVAAEYGQNTAAWWKTFETDFEAANENIDLVIDVVSWNDITTKVNTRIGNNDAPDILNIDSFADYQAEGLLLPAQDYISAETYAKFKTIREEHQKIYHIHSCVEKGCHAEQTHQKKDHRKQEER